MSQRARFQQGMVYRVKRKQGPDCWIFRWREEGADGKRVRRKMTLGTVKEYSTETSALKAAQVLRVTINAEQSQSSQQPVSVLALINHFKEHELGPIEDGEEEEGRAFSTRSTYIDILDFHVAKKWATTGWPMCAPLLSRSGCASWIWPGGAKRRSAAL
jgi:integrase